jgi:hypothetical protein
MVANNFPNIGYNTVGRDFNFFQKVTCTWTTFGGDSASGQQPDLIITFPTQGILLLNETSSTVVQVSYNGLTVHDELNASLPSQGIAYDNRVISCIWFRLETGASATISVRAWAVR